MTVDELVNNPEYVGKTVRVAGAVDGESIRYDEQNLVLDFVVANVPMEYDNLADALHNAVNNPGAHRIPVHIENQVKPDLLQHEAQAIMTGRLGEDGIFYVTELNLKCPTRFEAAQPEI
jgi:cytochrome c-type biogenesis protein CcmE